MRGTLRRKVLHQTKTASCIPDRAEHPIAYNLYKHNTLIYRH
jgi:hypothetical protein